MWMRMRSIVDRTTEGEDTRARRRVERVSRRKMRNGGIHVKASEIESGHRSKRTDRKQQGNRIRGITKFETRKESKGEGRKREGRNYSCARRALRRLAAL